MGGTRRVLQLSVAVLAALAAIAASVVLNAASATASVSHLRVGAVARLPRGARVNGPVAPSRSISLTVGLEPQNAAALQAFATAVSTPGSSQYGHYLSVPEFASRFGATDSEIAAVQKAFRSQGISVGQVAANHLTIPVKGSAAQVEQALSVSLDQVTLAGGRVAYANTTAPLLPSNVAQAVQGVIGLDNLVLPKPQPLTQHASLRSPKAVSQPNVVTGGPTPSCAGALNEQAGNQNATGNELGYTADQIATAYKFSSMFLAGDTGAGQTIAMYELQPFDPQDIATYQSCYGTAVPVTPVNIDGGPGVYGSSGHTDDGEAALDIEQAITTAPGASVLVYQAPNSASGAIDAYSAIVSQDQAKIVSSSWGSCEANETAGGGASIKTENTLFQEAAAQGQTIFVASGDSGSAACYQSNHANTSLSVQDPSAQPFVTGVGGTSLYANVNGNAVLYTPGQAPVEGVWNDGVTNGDAGATTGGLSTQWPMPSYQQGAAASLGVINANSIVSGISCGSTYCREVPDVSANGDADTGYVFNANQNQGGGWTVIGGTSAAAPLWAAYTALVNADSACRGLTVGFLNPSLYSIAGSSYLNNFSDVTQPSPVTGDASNDAIAANNGLFPVTANYDMTTGIGSMIAPNLAASLCAARAPVYTVAVASPGNQSSFVGTPVSLTVAGTDSGGAALHYAATGLPAGLAMAANGVITGTPTTAQTATVTVSAADGFTNGGSTSFAWSIVNRPPPPVIGKPKTKSVKFSGLGKRKPKLTLTLTAGANAPALKGASISLPNGLKFAIKAKTLDKGISLKSGKKKLKFSVSVKKGVLTLTFKSATRSAAMTLTKPAVTITASEATKIRKHKVKRLTIGLKTIDTSKKTVKLTIVLKKLS